VNKNIETAPGSQGHDIQVSMTVLTIGLH